jgi:putative FmdB family regulatory protein
MPFYEYQCSSCGHRHEELQKISDGRLRKCPDCGRNTLKRLVSAPAFRLKGGGWYETDFKGDKDRRNIAGDKEPVPDKPKDAKGDAVATEAKAKTDEAAKAAPPAEKPKPAADKPTPARKTRTRRRVRK